VVLLVVVVIVVVFVVEKDDTRCELRIHHDMESSTILSGQKKTIIILFEFNVPIVL
jgi:hypothetical protein